MVLINSSDGRDAVEAEYIRGGVLGTMSVLSLLVVGADSAVDKEWYVLISVGRDVLSLGVYAFVNVIRVSLSIQSVTQNYLNLPVSVTKQPLLAAWLAMVPLVEVVLGLAD